VVPPDPRFTNRNELASLLDLENLNPALPTGHPFMNFQSSNYWSSTTVAGGTIDAWFVGFVNGFMNSGDKPNGSLFVLPVRGGS
jgi:hypothetical protein